MSGLGANWFVTFYLGTCLVFAKSRLVDEQFRVMMKLSRWLGPCRWAGFVISQ